MAKNSKRRNRKMRRKNRRSNLDFQVLEPKQMLASVASTLPTGTNFIVNGEFNTSATGTADLMFTDAEVDGWQVSEAGQNFQLLNNFDSDRGNVLDLDSTAGQFDAVFQDIATEANVEYVLAFDLRERTALDGAVATTNDIEVFWDGVSQGIFRGVNHWHTVTLNVTGSNAATTRLEFRELTDTGASDGRGPLIDDVRLVNISDAVIQNGGFENLDNPGDSFQDTATVGGWNAMGDEGDRLFQIVTSDISRGGERHLNLDTSDTRLDRVFQQIDTVPGRSYYLTFDLRSASGEADADNELRVRWNNQWAGTFQGNADWQSFGLLLNADAAETLLVLREPPTGANQAGNGSGPLIDNVQIFSLDASPESLRVDANGSDSGVDRNTTYNEGAGTVTIGDSNLVVESDNGNLDGATATLTNIQTGESLLVDTTGTSITQQFNATTGVLTLSGSAAASEYQQVLQTLAYTNTNNNPTELNRVVDIAVSQGDVTGETAAINITVNTTNDGPRIDTINDVTDHTLGTELSIDVTATDPEGDTNFTYSVSATGTAAGGDSAQPSISTDGKITWTPERSGDAVITVNVSDSTGGSSQTTFNVSVARNATVPSDFAAFSGTNQLSNVEPTLRNDIYLNNPPAFNIDTDNTYQAVLTTDDGDIVIDLLVDEAPNTVNNFVNLARDGFFDGLTFHRVVTLSAAGDIAQGGDPLGVGNGGPGFSFDSEIFPGRNIDQRGLLAMANSGNDGNRNGIPFEEGDGTNGSQFFLTLAPQVHLNGLHTVFGVVSAGDEFMDQINKTGSGETPEVIQSVRIIES